MLTRELVVLARLLDATCGRFDDTVFSDLLRAPTDAVRTLERNGLLTVQSGVGRGLNAKWIETDFRQTIGEVTASPDQHVLDDIFFMFDQYVGLSGADVETLPDAEAWTYALAYLSSVGIIETRDAIGDQPFASQTIAKFRSHADFWRRRYPHIDWDTNPPA